MAKQWHEGPSCATARIALAPVAWRKSSYSDNAGNCIEAAVLGSAKWHKSSYSGDQGNCVEVAGGLPGVVAVRDSKDPDGPALVFGWGEWAGFVGRARRGEFGRP